jgi:hypothetical protein
VADIVAVWSAISPAQRGCVCEPLAPLLSKSSASSRFAYKRMMLEVRSRFVLTAAR